MSSSPLSSVSVSVLGATNHANKEVAYFAYGSNMSRLSLEMKGVKQLHRSVPAILKGFRLTFNLAPRNAVVDPSYANIESHDSSHVHGVLHAMSAESLNALDRIEAGYEKRLVHVLPYGQAVPVMAYVYICVTPPAGWDMEFRETAPSMRYMSQIINGAKHHRLAEQWITYLCSLPAVPLPNKSLEKHHTAAITARQLSSEEIASHNGATAGLPVYTVIKGIVFDISQQPSNFIRLMGGKDITLWLASRVHHERHTRLPCTISELDNEHKAYLNAIVYEYSLTCPIVGYTNYFDYDF
eukprot:GILJ01003125.1.p1 GENE.GILJ01003125.1~~GILJ01003125.1.p1  ORF type:complete len:297 (+),score=29.16 GILJ01003125.1:227-1117(+)